MSRVASGVQWTLFSSAQYAVLTTYRVRGTGDSAVEDVLAERRLFATDTLMMMITST